MLLILLKRKLHLKLSLSIPSKVRISRVPLNIKKDIVILTIPGLPWLVDGPVALFLHFHLKNWLVILSPSSSRRDVWDWIGL